MLLALQLQNKLMTYGLRMGNTQITNLLAGEEKKTAIIFIISKTC